MSLQQAVRPRSSVNGYSHRRVDKEIGPKMESKLQPGNLNSSRIAGISNGSKGGDESPSKDRLVYLTTCLIGHHVDVQVKTGSVYSGMFYATNADKDFGIVLKMARLVKDTPFRGQKGASESCSNAPAKTLIIPADDLVQIIAKGVPVTRDGLTDEHQAEKHQDLMIDSYISKSRHMEMGRELQRWVPDEDDPQRPELESIFDSPWTGSWDQFKVNETLFGVKSTFNEELYTTKLEKGPQTRGLEEEATRIAREIEGEETHDMHLAGERGVYPHGNFDIDEETMFSSVIRGTDDSGFIDEDVMLDAHNDETFVNSSEAINNRSFTDVTHGKTYDGGQNFSLSSMDKAQSSQLNLKTELCHSGSLASKTCLRNAHSLEEERVCENQVAGGEADASVKEFVGVQTLNKELHLTKTAGLHASVTADKGVLSPDAAAYAPSDASVKGQEKTSSVHELSEDACSGKGLGVAPSRHSHQPASSASSTPKSGAATSAFSGPGLSPSSSVGSLSSEKSTLNPNAKEFKFNPNAKSFVPSQVPVRPISPVNDGSYYYPTNVPPVPHMHGMPVGIGVPRSFSGPQPMIFNPQVAPMPPPPQGYFPANGPQYLQYGQQMILGHPRQVSYMPGYPTEMTYRGREF